MARRSKAALDASAQVDKIREMLTTFANKLQTEDLRSQVIALIPAVHALRDLGAGLIPPEIAKSARDRILAYFLKYPLQLVNGDELLVISGIGEWARRLRELRVQFGWSICSGVTIRDLERDDPDLLNSIAADLGIEPRKIKTDQYVMLRTDQDRDAAHRWNLLNTIRKRKVGVKAKILEYLRENVGRPVTIEELRYLANNTNEWARRARELRTEDGWPVYTRMQGRAELPVGTYVLDEDKQAPEHDRNIPDDVRIEVLERDHFACRVCGWKTSDLRPEDPRKFLELHHIVEHAKRGDNSVGNLITLCNVHHDQVHAGRLDLAEVVRKSEQ
jgi:hypothetical protein